MNLVRNMERLVHHWCHRHEMSLRWPAVVFPNTWKLSYCAVDDRWPTLATQTQSNRLKQQTSSKHQIVQCPFRNRNQTYWCGPVPLLYFVQLQFHICTQNEKKHEWNWFALNWLKLLWITYDGNLWVISEHQVMKPSVIIIADPNVSKQDMKPNTVSKNSPKNVESNLVICSRAILQNKTIKFHWLDDVEWINIYR